MKSIDIKPWQAEKIVEALRPTVSYLNRLVQRMEKRGFPPDDPYFQMVCKAYDAMHELHVKTHYLKCDGVWKRRAESDQE